MIVMFINPIILAAFLALSLQADPANMQETTPGVPDRQQTNPSMPDPQETTLTVFDLVQAPAAWTGHTGNDWDIAFRETWSVDPARPAITKNVDDWTPHNDSLSTLPPDSARNLFMSMVMQNADAVKRGYLADVFYEFVLLEPHAAGSGMTGFPAPDSMDAETRQLQGALIALADRHSQAGRRFNLEEQLLSVWFSETWLLDPATMEITREVRSITPVIWQRRKTTEGEAIDEPTTGYPVYYKNQLQPIFLRNP